MIEPKRTAAPVTAIRPEVGVPGLSQWGGYVDDEWDRRIKQRRNKLETYREMLDDPTVSAARTALDAYVRSAKMTIEPNEAVPDQDAVTFIESAIYEMDESWESTLSEIMTFVDYGFSLFEVLPVERDGKNGRSNDGKIGWRQWAPRSQETIESWTFEDEGRTVTAAVQRFPNSGKEVRIPLSYCLHFKTKNRKASPEGRSLIRPAFDAWYAKTNLSRIERIGVERDLNGIPIAWVPSDVYADLSKRGAWESLVRNIRRDEHTGLVMPMVYDDDGNKLYDVGLMTTGGQRSTDTNALIAREERNILRVLLSDWMQLGDSGGGSFALGVSKAEMFVQFVQGLLDIIADTITNQAIRPLCEANGIPDDHAPKLVFEQISKRDLTSFASAFQMLVNAGSVDATDPDVRTVVYTELGIPAPQDGFDDPEEVKPEQKQPPVTEPEGTPPTGEPKAPIADTQTFTEPLNDDLMARARKVWKDTVGDQFEGLFDAQLEVK